MQHSAQIATVWHQSRIECQDHLGIIAHSVVRPVFEHTAATEVGWTAPLKKELAHRLRSTGLVGAIVAEF